MRRILLGAALTLGACAHTNGVYYRVVDLECQERPAGAGTKVVQCRVPGNQRTAKGIIVGEEGVALRGQVQGIGSSTH